MRNCPGSILGRRASGEPAGVEPCQWPDGSFFIIVSEIPARPAFVGQSLTQSDGYEEHKTPQSPSTSTVILPQFRILLNIIQGLQGIGCRVVGSNSILKYIIGLAYTAARLQSIRYNASICFAAE